MQDFLFLTSSYGIDLDGHQFEFKGQLYPQIEILCLSHGSSIEGRKMAMTYYTGHRVILPLVVSHHLKRFYLITRSLKASDLALINYERLIRYQKIEPEVTRLYFDNGFYHDIALDYRIIKRQVAIMTTYLKAYYKSTQERTIIQQIHPNWLYNTSI